MKQSNIPSLKSSTGEWITDSRQKANLFRDAWMHKNRLPPFDNDALFFTDGGDTNARCIAIGVRACLRTFKKLKNDSATGPDGISARIIKFIGPFIAKFFVALIKRMQRSQSH